MSPSVQLLERILWSFAPLACAAILPPAMAFWIESHRLRAPFREVAMAVIADYSRPFGDSLAVTTTHEMLPFLFLTVICFIVSKWWTRCHIIALLLTGLALICAIQIPLTIRMLKRIPDGEAEFIEVFYVFISFVTTAVLITGLGLLRRFNPSRCAGCTLPEKV